MSIYNRALKTEQVLRAGMDAIGGPEAEALFIFFCLKPGTTGMTPGD